MTGPAPERLFRAMDATWPPARFLRQGPWLLREGRGGGQRVSAATAADAVSDRDIATAETGMRAIDQRALFMIRPDDADLDAWLAAREYEIVDPVILYVAPVGTLTRALPVTRAIPSWPPLAMQKDIWTAGGIGQGRLDVMARVKVATTILGRTGDLPAGTAFVGVDGKIGMLHALEVDPRARRKGVGNALMTAAANWIADRGCDWIAVAVTRANVAANALYRQIGMTEATEYHYRRAPEAAS